MLPDAYGCAVANRFGNLLDDDDSDPFELISKVEMAKEKKKKDAEGKKGKQTKHGQKESQKDRRLPITSEGKDSVPARQQQQQQQQQTSPGTAESKNLRVDTPRGTKRVAFRESGANQQELPQEFSVSRPSYTAESGFIGRGGTRGRRGYPRNLDNFNPRGKREYDGYSGTGITPAVKRGGRRPWNWGSTEEVLSASMEVASDVLVNTEKPQIPGEENPNRLVEDGEMVLQVAMEMTLDEWKALQETSRPKTEFNIRKAEDKIPSKAKVIHQSKNLEKLKGMMEDMEDDSHFLRKSVNDITSLLDINFGSLGRPSRGGRGWEARGGTPSRPERAKPLLVREDDPAPNPDDPEDFPALSTGR